MAGSHKIVALLILTVAALVSWFLLGSSITKQSSGLPSTIPVAEVAILLALEGPTYPEVLDSWSAFASLTGYSIFVVCGNDMHVAVASQGHVHPLVVEEDTSWADALTQFIELNMGATAFGVVGEGAVPGPGLTSAQLALDMIAIENSPTAALGRARWLDLADGDRSTWLPATFVGHAWCNRAMLDPVRTRLFGLDKSTVETITFLDVVNRISQPISPWGRPGIQLIDGTEFFPVDILSHTTSVNVPRTSARHPPEGAGKVYRESHHRENHARDVFGGLGLSLLRRRRSGWSDDIIVTIVRSRWPPPYMLEWIAKETSNLVVVTNVNCGYLDMAVNFARSVHEVSAGTKV